MQVDVAFVMFNNKSIKSVKPVLRSVQWLDSTVREVSTCVKHITTDLTRLRQGVSTCITDCGLVGAEEIVEAYALSNRLRD